MSDFAINLISGVVLLALAGLTTIAVRQPQQYSEVVLPAVWVLGGIAYAAMMGWGFAILSAQSAVSQFHIPGASEQPFERVSELRLPYWAVVGGPVAGLYFLLLRLLPQLGLTSE